MARPVVLDGFAIGGGVWQAYLLGSMQEIIYAALVHREAVFFQRVPQAAVDFKQQGVGFANCFAGLLGKQRSR